VNKGVRDTVISIAVAAVAVTVMFSGLYVYSGIWPPFSVVESGSMQHSSDSTFNTIDTGDVVVIRSMEKTNILTYVDGYKENYKKFGDYGDVIIYERKGMNPVIHRAVIWLDWNGDGTWSAPSLKGFMITSPEGDLIPGWSCGTKDGATKITNVNELRGILTFHYYGHASMTIHLDLDWIDSNAPWSGYATKGDNPATNETFDYGGYMIGGATPKGVQGVHGLIPAEKVMYVAGVAIPWLGILKLYLSGDQKAMSEVPANSIPDMIIMTVGAVSLLAAVFVFAEYISWRRHRDKE
jgi:signal peptidase